MKRLFAILFFVPMIVQATITEKFPLRDNGTIPLWLVAGPFPNGNAGGHGEGCFGYFKDYLLSSGSEAQAKPQQDEIVQIEDGRTLLWKAAFSDENGVLDYVKIFKNDKNTPAVAYAFCQLNSVKSQTVRLNIGSDDGVRLWLNGNKIHDFHLGRSLEIGEDKVTAELKKGENYLLIKVDQGGGDWGMSASITDLAGKGVPGVSASLSLKSPLAGNVISANFQSLPLVAKTKDGDKQIIAGEILSGGLKNVTCLISKADWQKPVTTQFREIPLGEFHFNLNVPVIQKAGTVDITLMAEKFTKKFEGIEIDRPRYWQVYFVQHVHTDIGYTRPQTEILPEHLRFIDTALDYCDLTDNYPDDAQFRWTCEVSWPVREYLRRRPEQQIERLKKRVAEGRMEVTGMFLNMSEIATEDALVASLQPIRECDQVGIPVQTAMQNDVNGIAWCLVDYFSDMGVKYVTMGINKTRSILPFDKPTLFWWESPSGKRVLAFRSDHYHYGNFFRIHEGKLDKFEPQLFEYLTSLEERGYPFDRIAVEFSGYHTDNSPPSTSACELVQAWNEKYVSPKLRIATAKEFLSFIEKNHAAKLPVYRAAWPDWWTDGFGSAAQETAEARRIHQAIQIDQNLFALAKLLGAQISTKTLANVAAVQDELLFYDEHTFGAAESISDPLAENSLVQWGEKSSYAWEAVKKEGLLREEALGLLQSFLPRCEVPTLAVFNTLNWQRSGLVEVFIDHQFLPLNVPYQIIDVESKDVMPAQLLRNRSEGSYWAIWVQDVPAMGYKMLKIIAATETQQELVSLQQEATEIENKFYKMKFDNNRAAITSLVDKQLNRELVAANCQWQFGQMIYEQLKQGRDFSPNGFDRQTVSHVKLEKMENTALWKSIRFTANLPGCDPGGVDAEIRLFNVEKRIELNYKIRKQRITEAEALYVAFPFDIPNGKIFYEAQGGIVTPGVNQLPGSASDWQTVQNFVSIRNDNSQIIWGSKEIPLVQFGDINLGKWQYEAQVEQPHLYSWILNNYWFTNFRAFQEGEFKWHYYLTTTSDNSNKTATRFAAGSATPLVPRLIAPGKLSDRPTSLSSLKIEATNILLISAKPSLNDSGIILQIRETEGEATVFPLSQLSPKIATIDEINALEKPKEKAIIEIQFKPWEVKFLKLNLVD